MLRSPALYGVCADYQDGESLIQKRADIINSAAAILDCFHYISFVESSTSGFLRPRCRVNYSL